MQKNWYKSKTLWVNAATLAAGAIGLFIANATDLGLSTQTVLYLGMGISIVNMALRTITNEPITFTKSTG